MNNQSPARNNRILVIDDNPSIHADIRKILSPNERPNTALADAKALLFDETPTKSSQTDFEIVSAFQGEEGLGKVQEAAQAGRPFAMAFVDVRMPPGWDGVETITRIWKDNPDLQVVICTAYSDYSWEEMIGHIGKSDNLLILKKPFDNIEVLQLAHALTQKWALRYEISCRLNDLDQLVTQRTSELQSANDKLKREITDRLQMEKALRLSEERFSKAFRASPIPLAIQSLREERFIDVNEGFQKLAGFTREELIGHTPEELNFWSEPGAGRALLKKLHQEMSVLNLPCRLRSKSGQTREALLSVELFELDGEPFLLTIAEDITEQIKLENQLRQAQKMEAVGQLAAGVAHDFNNILTVINGHASLLLAAKPPESPDRRSLQSIAAAADRASKLVRQLLTFSRKQFIQVQSLDVGHALASIAEMLPRVLREDVAVEIKAQPELPPINADAGMIEQMLMNLAVNARDAMAGGGRLALEARLVEITAETAQQNQEARPGKFICLSVRDTGCGIPPEILPRIFEPFFTTKPVGKGTGLGLATVYGIAKQHDGWIEVQTQVEQGTTFNIFLPVSECKPEAPAAPPVARNLKGGSETLLVAEDEDEVRDFAVQLLKSHGYNVVCAASGPEALQKWSERKNEIQLLLTDMVMPGGLTGRQLGERVLQEKPSLPVIYTSGYSPGMAGRDLALLEGANFLAKPYGPARLLHMVRDCLDRRAAACA
ncbi:MAG TPA: response regulator [Verrucomicrobiae bacterium]|nr:response regulator [Verrucomicrobiae bacterium]